ncbi:MAG TPA: class I SAM-dependent methyltransferase [Bacteroidia bacterium]|nr:class I SAM-dependent methyltransferase [Bacteroidia bacterium]
MNPAIKQFYNGAYFFLQATLPVNPFIPRKINGSRVRKGHIRIEQETNPRLDELIIQQLNEERIENASYKVDIDAFRKYYSDTPYPQDYYGNKNGRDDNFIEKALEHFVSLQLLHLNRHSTLIDIGAGNSPFTEIVKEKSGTAKAYSQDKYFKEGFNENKIGGSASRLPFEDGSIDAMTLHCSLEHFEGNQDTGFFIEAERVLKKGGKCIVLPFYLSSQYTVHLDPVNNLLKCFKPVLSDEGAVIRYCDSRQAFSRHYDVKTFRQRILNNIHALHPLIYRVENFKEVYHDCYLRFVLVMTKL